MDCDKVLELLSDFRDELLEEAETLEVTTHLSWCVDCRGVYYEIDVIVAAAGMIWQEHEILYPDEHVIWQRLSLRQ